jgi:hypothetical protein
MAKAKKIEEAQVVDPIAAEPEKAAPKSKENEQEADMTVRCSYPITINGTVYEGDCTVSRATAEVLIEMLSKKRQADMNVFVGKSFLVERVLGTNALVITDQNKKRV